MSCVRFYNLAAPLVQGLWPPPLAWLVQRGSAVPTGAFGSLPLPDCVTAAFIPVKPFEGQERRDGLALEVDEFVPEVAKYCCPFTAYRNRLYIYPLHLKYDGQKTFAKVNRKASPARDAREGEESFLVAKTGASTFPCPHRGSLFQARNIAIRVEFKDSDEGDAKALKVLQSRAQGRGSSRKKVVLLLWPLVAPGTEAAGGLLGPQVEFLGYPSPYAAIPSPKPPCPLCSNLWAR